MLADAAGRTFDYDAENRQVAFQGGLAQHFYGGEGRRVREKSGAEVTIYVYNILGQLAVEYSTAANPESGPRYLTIDHLGSTRVVADGTGGVLSRYDDLPFGKEIAGDCGDRNTVAGYGGIDTVQHKFTGKERESESGLDYFTARYYDESAHGTFSLDNPAEAVQVQQLLNDRNAALGALPTKGRSPLPPDVMEKMRAAERALVPSERHVQQVEKIITGELRATRRERKR